MPTKTRVFIVSTDEKEAEYLAGILPEDRFESNRHLQGSERIEIVVGSNRA